MNSKWIEDLHIRPQTIKFLEENIGGKLHDIELGNDFLDMTPKAQKINANKMTNGTSRDTTNRVKSQFMEWEYLQIIYLMKG